MSDITPTDVLDLTCAPDVTAARIEICVVCENMVMEAFPKCKQCDCPISSLTSMSFKTCPIGKW